MQDEFPLTTPVPPSGGVLTDTSRYFIAVKNARRSVTDVFSFETNLIIETHIVFSALSPH